jgi:hypothetical protein
VTEKLRYSETTSTKFRLHLHSPMILQLLMSQMMKALLYYEHRKTTWEPSAIHRQNMSESTAAISSPVCATGEAQIILHPTDSQHCYTRKCTEL